MSLVCSLTDIPSDLNLWPLLIILLVIAVVAIFVVGSVLTAVSRPLRESRERRLSSWLCRSCGGNVAIAEQSCPWCSTPRPELLRGGRPKSVTASDEPVYECPNCDRLTAASTRGLCAYCDTPLGPSNRVS